MGIDLHPIDSISTQSVKVDWKEGEDGTQSLQLKQGGSGGIGGIG